MQTLRELYQDALPEMIAVRETFRDVDLEGPLLMDPGSYFQQQIRLLIVGQETRGWHCEYDNIEEQMRYYREFDVGRTYRNSPIWSITRKLEIALKIAPFSCAWVNLNRFDFEAASPPAEIEQELVRLDFMVREEIRIIRPDVCLFYTNRKYDYRLQQLYDGLGFQGIEGLPEPHFARLFHDQLPIVTLRTPHPRYIRMSRVEPRLINYLEQVGRSDGLITSNGCS